jgi:hypothetical protein
LGTTTDEKLMSPLEQVMQLRGVSYLWKWEGGHEDSDEDDEGDEGGDTSGLPAHMRGHARMQSNTKKGSNIRSESKVGSKTIRRQLGFIAQEVEEVVPEMVHTDSEGFKSVAYSRLLPVVVEAMKEQDLQYKQELEELRGQNSKLAADVRSLKEQGLAQQQAMEDMQRAVAELQARGASTAK